MTFSKVLVNRERSGWLAASYGHVHRTRTPLVTGVQEYCNGGSLRGLLAGGCFCQEESASHWRSVVHAMKSIAGGMRYVHGKRICHGDLNPSNVLLKVCSRRQFL